MDRTPTAAQPPAKTCETPSLPSKLTLQSATKALDHDDWRSAARAVTVAEAQAVLDGLQGHDHPCPAAEAATFAGQLVNYYPAREVNDARSYIAALTALFAAFPRAFAKRVCDPVTGLPSRLKFLPTLAEVREALDAEATRRKRIAANAQYVLDQAAKRAAEAEEEARFNAKHPGAPERARQVQELLRGLGRPTKGEAA